jgi:hypothetical protein
MLHDDYDDYRFTFLWKREALRANRLAWLRSHPSEPRDVSRRGRKPRVRFERHAKEATRDVRVDVWQAVRRSAGPARPSPFALRPSPISGRALA